MGTLFLFLSESASRRVQKGSLRLFSSWLQLMSFKKKKDPTSLAFTIVELLIVVVVIAILAAITIVAYNGIQNRTYDSVVQSDLATFKKKLESHAIQTPGYQYASGPYTLADFKVSKSSYAVSPASAYNFNYCWNASNSAAGWGVIAMSKSGKKYAITNTTGLVEWSNSVTDCATLSALFTNNYAGYNSTDTTTGPWRAYVGGN